MRITRKVINALVLSRIVYGGSIVSDINSTNIQNRQVNLRFTTTYL